MVSEPVGGAPSRCGYVRVTSVYHTKTAVCGLIRLLLNVFKVSVETGNVFSGFDLVGQHQAGPSNK